MSKQKSASQVLVPMVGTALVALLLAATQAGASPPAQAPATVEAQAVSSPVLHYQGRLLDPSTGNPKPNGNYNMTFRLYGVEAGGAALWSEARSVFVSNGLFSTLLGQTTPLNLNHFDGRDLWLGITVGADPEATPRQRVAYVGYALRAKNAEFATNADTTDGQHAAAFANAAHNHDASYYTESEANSRFVNDSAGEVDNADVANGALAPAKIAGTAWTSTNDGSGTGLEADRLDGKDSTAFAEIIHRHSGEDIVSGALSTDLFSAYNDLVAETKIGTTGTQVAAGNHDHDSRYVNVTGDAMSGSLTVPAVTYTAPRTHYFVVGGEGFVPGSNVDYVNTYGNGGAYISSGWGALVAPVHLPQGAVVTEFKVFFDDTSASDMSVLLYLQGMAGGYALMAEVASSGASGYYSQTDTTISSATIDNTIYSYLIDAYSTAWDSNLRIKGALVTYTISEAP